MIQQRLQFSAPDFSIAHITPSDVRKRTDNFYGLQGLISENEPMYPGIDRWFDGKVCSGLLTSERSAFVGILNGKPVASAIVKRAERAKICHLSVSAGVQEQHLGELFFVLMILQVQHRAKALHFTLPEGLWEKRSGFFESFGFRGYETSRRQYRGAEQEYSCSAQFSEVWTAMSQKLPKLATAFTSNGYGLNKSLVMSLKPRWAEAILSGKKTVEIRRAFSQKWEGHDISLYAAAPVQSLVGEARIERVVSGSADDLWLRYQGALGCDRQALYDYAAGAPKIFALELKGIRRFPVPIKLKNLAAVFGEAMTAPQSYARINSASSWARYVALSALLNGEHLASW